MRNIIIIVVTTCFVFRHSRFKFFNPFPPPSTRTGHTIREPRTYSAVADRTPHTRTALTTAYIGKLPHRVRATYVGSRYMYAVHARTHARRPGWGVRGAAGARKKTHRVGRVTRVRVCVDIHTIAKNGIRKPAASIDSRKQRDVWSIA